VAVNRRFHSNSRDRAGANLQAGPTDATRWPVIFKPDESNERRKKERFPLIHELRYAILENGHAVRVGFGLTSEMSSAGVAFTADRHVPAGRVVEIAIDWPVPLDNDCPLQLVALGWIARSQGLLVACTIERSEFRTRSRMHAEAVAPSDLLWTGFLRTKGPFARYRASASSRSE
jgi:hypothetical protein